MSLALEEGPTNLYRRQIEEHYKERERMLRETISRVLEENRRLEDALETDDTEIVSLSELLKIAVGRLGQKYDPDVRQGTFVAKKRYYDRRNYRYNGVEG